MLTYLISFVLQKGKRHPPLLRDYPPVAGSITWERQLYDRLKKKVLSFQNVKEFENSGLKTNVSFIYPFVVFYSINFWLLRKEGSEKFAMN